MRVLMLSRDVAGTDPSSCTAARWRLLRDHGVELEIIVATQKNVAWEEPGLRVQGSGGVNPLTRLMRLYRLAQTRVATVDLITAADPFELGLAAWRLATHFAKRFEVQDHGGFFDGEALDEPLWFIRSVLARFVMRRAHAVRTVSPKSFEMLTTRHQKDDVYFLPIAAEARFSSLERHPDPNLIVSVGRLVSVKRMDLLLNAFAALHRQRPAARLVIVGDGPLRSPLEKMTRKLGIAAAVEYTGAADPSLYLVRAGLFVLLSKHEGWGIAPVEAALAGVPVLMTDTGCARWLAERGVASIVPMKARTEQIAEQMGDALCLRKGATLDDAKTSDEVAIEQVKAWERIVQAKPRILVCVQAVDEKDPLMGFFVGWLRAFAREARVLVCALRVSDPLPVFEDEVDVRSTRSSESRSRLEVLWNVARLSWRERFRYEAVFIRGDAQYIACLGWLWRLLGKKIVFWYTHYTVTGPWFWLALPWAHEVVTAVEESNPLASSLKIGHHIDTSLFAPGATSERGKRNDPRVLLFGRVSAVKRVSWVLATMKASKFLSNISVLVIGAPANEHIRQETLAALPSRATWTQESVAPHEVPGIFRSSDIFVNATPGSMDKTILEAAASGCVVLAASEGMRYGLPSDLHWLIFSSQDELCRALEKAVSMSVEERRQIGMRLREWVQQQHSLEAHIPRLISLLVETSPRPTCRQRVKRWMWRLKTWGRGPSDVHAIMFHAMDGKGVAAWDAYRFQAFITRLRSRRVSVLKLKDIWNESGFRLPPAGILLTIDDATEDFFRIASILRRENVSVTLFAPSDLPMLKTSEGLSRRVLNERELHRLHDERLVEIGGHGKTHQSLTGMDTDAVRKEVEASIAFAQLVNQSDTPPVFAYPKGKSNKIVRELVRSAGFVAAFGVMPGAWTPAIDLFFIPRFPIMAWMTSKDVVAAIRVS